MTEQEWLRAEVRAMRAEIAALHRVHAGGRTRHGWLKPLLRDLETNPRTQFKVHVIGAYFWLVTAIPILVLFFAFPDLWLSIGVLITLLYSLYANFATDYGAASAALAAMGRLPLPEIPTEPA